MTGVEAVIERHADDPRVALRSRRSRLFSAAAPTTRS